MNAKLLPRVSQASELGPVGCRALEIGKLLPPQPLDDRCVSPLHWMCWVIDSRAKTNCEKNIRKFGIGQSVKLRCYATP